MVTERRSTFDPEGEGEGDGVELLPHAPAPSRKLSLTLGLTLGLILLVGVFSLVMVSIRIHGPQQTYTNPLLRSNAPDPGVLLHDGTFYLVTSSGTIGTAQDAFPIYCGSSLFSWEACGRVFPGNAQPTWTSGVDLLAPEIHVVGSKFVTYFAARHAVSGQMAVGVATSDKVVGPYSDSGEPLVAGTGAGARDPHVFYDPVERVRFLVWKEDGEAAAPAQDPVLVMQQLAADGLSVTGPRLEVVRPTLAWERGVVRAPWIIRRDGFYYLFYSVAGETSTHAAVAVARSASPRGPYEKHPTPVLSTPANASNYWEGPSHCAVVLAVADATTPSAAASATAAVAAGAMPVPGVTTDSAGSVPVSTSAPSSDPSSPSTASSTRDASAASPATAAHTRSVGTVAVPTVAHDPARAPTPDFFLLYAAWQRGFVGAHYPRLLLGDAVRWHRDGWPVVHNGQPSDTSQVQPVAGLF